MSLDFTKLKSLKDIYSSKPDEQQVSAQRISLDLIDEDPDQPRKEFDQAALEELAETIREHDVAQPVILRQAMNGRFIIVMGARRCRAARLAGKADVPAVFRTQSDDKLRAMQMIENVQRADLRPDEIAAYIQQELDGGKSKTEIARSLGKNKDYVSLYARFLSLPPCIRTLYDRGLLTDMRTAADLARAHAQNSAAVDALCGAVTVPVTRGLLDTFLAQHTVAAGSQIREFDTEESSHDTDPVFDNLPAHSHDDDALRRDEATPTFTTDESDGESGAGDAGESGDESAKPKSQKWHVLVQVGRDRGKLTMAGAEAPEAEHLMVSFEDGNVSAVPVGRIKLLGPELR